MTCEATLVGGMKLRRASVGEGGRVKFCRGGGGWKKE